jgi:hypothetical protein
LPASQLIAGEINDAFKAKDFNKISEIPQKIAIAMDRPVSEGEFDLSQNTWIDRAINFTEQILQR